jgi:hypothetical protein
MDADLCTPAALRALGRLADDILLAAGSGQDVRVVRQWGRYLGDFSNFQLCSR